MARGKGNSVNGGTMKKILIVLLAQSLLSVSMASANTPVSIIGSKFMSRAIPDTALVSGIKNRFDVEKYREVRAQVIYTAQGEKPDHLLVYLFENGFHKVNFAKVSLDSSYKLGSVVSDYKLGDLDHSQQLGHADTATCPDTSVQMIAFAPNDDDLEQQVTVEVATAATKAGLKTVSLLKGDATRQAYMNYMSCPNLIGNFYDGDANTGEMVTVDGSINSDDYSSTLKGAFRHKVINIWLACEAYNDPMLTAVRDTAASQKYAAGINDLEVGPSDKAAACAMEAAIQGQAVTAAFQDCYKKLDNSADHWGFGGEGADFLGK
jgi:hypothetical protein